MFSFGCEHEYRAHNIKEIGMTARKLCLYPTTIIPKRKVQPFPTFSTSNNTVSLIPLRSLPSQQGKPSITAGICLSGEPCTSASFSNDSEDQTNHMDFRESFSADRARLALTEGGARAWLDAAGRTATLGRLNPVARRIADENGSVWARGAILVAAGESAGAASLCGGSDKADSKNNAWEVHLDGDWAGWKEVWVVGCLSVNEFESAGDDTGAEGWEQRRYLYFLSDPHYNTIHLMVLDLSRKKTIMTKVYSRVRQRCRSISSKLARHHPFEWQQFDISQIWI